MPNALIGVLVGPQHELGGEIGENRCNAWPRLPMGAKRNAIIDYVAGVVVAERLVASEPGFQVARERAEMIARAAMLPRGSVRLLRGATQALSGSSFDVAPATEAPESRAPRSSQVGDDFLGAIVPQGRERGASGAKDLYALTGMETKMASQVGEAPAQLSKTRERLEGMGIRVGGDVFVPADHAKPGENRLFTAADLGHRMGWLVAARRDARRSEAGWRTLQRSCDRAVAQPPGSVGIIRLPVRNESLRRYAEHLMDVLTEERAQRRNSR